MTSGWLPNVVPNAPIVSTWGNSIRDRTLTVFDTPAQRDAQVTAPTEGMTCYIISTKQVYIYKLGAWFSTTAPPGIIATGTSVPTPALNALLNLSTVLAGPASWLAANTITLPAGADGLYLIQLDLSYRSDAVAGIYWEIANGSGVAYAPDMRCNIAHTISTIAARYQSSWLRQCVAGEGFQVRYRGNALAGSNFMQAVRLSLLKICDALPLTAMALPAPDVPTAPEQQPTS